MLFLENILVSKILVRLPPALLYVSNTDFFLNNSFLEKAQSAVSYLHILSVQEPFNSWTTGDFVDVAKSGFTRLSHL